MQARFSRGFGPRRTALDVEGIGRFEDVGPATHRGARRIEYEPADGERLSLDAPLALEIGGDRVGARASKPRKRYMRLEIATLRREACFARCPLVGPAQDGEPFRWRETGKDRARLVATETAEAVELELERSGVDLAQGECEIVCGGAVDIADEAKREVIILGIDPARATESCAQHRQPRGDALRDLDGGEESGHGGRLTSIHKHSR